MKEFFKRHRGKLCIAQAIGFVLLGAIVAFWFGRGSEVPNVTS